MNGTLIVERVEVQDLVVSKGNLEGYACTWAFKEDGIQFLPGCFRKTLAERAGKIPLMVKHGAASVLETVGFIMEGREDDKGLWIRGEFLDTELGQATRTQALKGGVKGLSINARSIKYVLDHDIIVTSEASLREVTLTNLPWDPDCEVRAVRDGAATEPDGQSTQPDAEELAQQVKDAAEAEAMRAERELRLMEIST